MSRADGKRAAVHDLVGAAADEHRDLVAASEGEQLPMFPVPTRFGGRRGAHLQLAIREHHGAGRPPGAQNKSTEEFRAFLLARGVSPLSQMMRWSMMTPTTLSAELGCTRTKAFELLKDLWAELAPFLHQRMPLAVEVDQRTAGFLILGSITADQAAGIKEKTGFDVLELVAREIHADQGFPDDQVAKSQGDKSQGSAK